MTTPLPTIRLMTLDDYAAAYRLWQQTAGMGLHPQDDSCEGFTRYLRRNPTSCFIAEQAGSLVGTILCGHDGRRGFIYHLAVAESARRNGLASRLVEQALAALRQENIQKVAFLVYRSNSDGNTFWDTQGFSYRQDVFYRDKWL